MSVRPADVSSEARLLKDSNRAGEIAAITKAGGSVIQSHNGTTLIITVNKQYNHCYNDNRNKCTMAS